MSFLQPWMLLAIPLIAIPILIHLINQWRYQTKRWGAMMFLLAANRMNRGYAKLRQWLILAMRVLAITGLIFAVSRPLASGFLGLSAGSSSDAAIVLLDRSPSMQQQSASGQSKLATGRLQLADALSTLGATHWVLIESNSAKPQSFESIEALVDSPAVKQSSSTADIPAMLQSVVDYINTNQPGPTDVWICSDLRSADWNSESSHWNAVRDALKSAPQSVRLHLLAYPQKPDGNLAIRVTDAHHESSDSKNSLVMSFQITRNGSGVQQSVPVQIEIDGARSELSVEMTSNQVEIRNHRVPLSGNQKTGYGKVGLPADENNADNTYYFVYADSPPRRIVLVSDNRQASMALEIAAAISPDGQSNSQVDLIEPSQLDSLLLDNAALVIWQAALPDQVLAKSLVEYLERGGQVMFFPPQEVVTGIGQLQTDFLGVRWGNWIAAGDEKKVMAENRRPDQDLLSVTQSGTGLPVAQLEVSGYAELVGDYSTLATLGGSPLLARVPTDKGAAYFWTVTTDPVSSTLATNGIVLYAAIQRAIEQGVSALGNATQRVAGAANEDTSAWRNLMLNPSSADQPLSSEYGWQAGVYECEGLLFALNRSLAEDQVDIVEDKQLDRLFAGLEFSRVDDQAGNFSGIVREIWRAFLVAMILALIVEAILCMPRKMPLVAVNR